MKAGVSKLIQYLIFLGLGVGLFALLINGVDTHQVLASLKNANYFWVALSAIGAFISHLIRAERWRILLEPLGHNISLTRSFWAIILGYLANFAIPRTGEIARCGAIAKSDGIPISKLIGTVVAERFIDIICLVLLLGLTVLTQLDLLKELLTNLKNIFLTSWTDRGALYIGILFGGLLSLLSIYIFLSKKIRQKVIRFKNGLIEGVSSLLKIRRGLEFYSYSGLMWFMYFLMSYFIFFAFKDTSHLRLDAGLSVLTIGSVGVTIPTPGGLGSFHALVSETLQLYGVEAEPALAYAVIVWMAQFVMILLTGIFALYYFFSLNRTKKA